MKNKLNWFLTVKNQLQYRLEFGTQTGFMYSSSQNPSFLKSKVSVSAQHSELIFQQSAFPDKQNGYPDKQNYSYHLNKSYAQMLKQKSGMAKSKSRSVLMGDSKPKTSLVPIGQKQIYDSNQQRSRISNRSMLKSHNNIQKLKVLTQSDLTQNYDEDQDQMFQIQNDQYEGNNRNRQFHQLKYNQSKPKTQLNQSSQNKNVCNRGPNLNPNIYEDFEQKGRQICDQGQSQGQDQSQSYIPPFSLIPCQKLEIKYFQNQRNNVKNANTFMNLIRSIPRDFAALKSVKRLIITNCFLSSLQGIQYFDNIQDINFRKNQLREVQQLYRISNKSKIQSINITGNDIEYFHQARYQNLTQVFVNLKELNDKNYSMLSKKNSGDMNKVIRKSARIQYQLRKTLKKQTKKTDRALSRFDSDEFKCHQQYRCRQETQGANQNQCPDIFNKRTEQDECSYGHYSSRDGSVSKRQNTQIKSPKYIRKDSCVASFKNKGKQIGHQNEIYEIHPSNLNPNSYSLGQNSNGKHQYVNTGKCQPLKQVSLGNLENVPIIKSVYYGQKSEKLTGKKRLQENKENIGQNYENEQIPLQTVPIGKGFLQIKTQGLDNVSEMGSHLHQPTATFAMQKQKQQKYSQQNKQFMFKNKSSKQRAKLQIKQTQILSQQEFVQVQDQVNDMNSSRLSKISQIPTKRISNNPRRQNNSFLNAKVQNRSKYEGNVNENTSEQSFMTNNEFNFCYNNQNASYMAYSQLSQYRPNQSMDEDCLLKDKKNILQEEQVAIVKAIYMQNLIRKAFYGLIIQGKKRRNMPKKRTFF